MNPRDFSFRWRSTHQSHIGLCCPKCREPLSQHALRVPEASWMKRMNPKGGVYNRHGLRCFEVLVR